MEHLFVLVAHSRHNNMNDDRQTKEPMCTNTHVRQHMKERKASHSMYISRVVRDHNLCLKSKLLETQIWSGYTCTR